MLLGVMAANRDPAVYPEPDRFDVTRQPASVMTFGFGAHFCLGAHLARAELDIALRVILSGCPTCGSPTPTEYASPARSTTCCAGRTVCPSPSGERSGERSAQRTTSRLNATSRSSAAGRVAYTTARYPRGWCARCAVPSRRRRRWSARCGQVPASSRRGLSTSIVSTLASVTPRSSSRGTKSVTRYVYGRFHTCHSISSRMESRCGAALRGHVDRASAVR